MKEVHRSIRFYQRGDEAVLIDLWNRAYRGYGGYVQRSVEHWRWCILDRPGITADDILIAQVGNTIQGYGVLGQGGYVLEFVVEPSIPQEVRTGLAVGLCEALESRAIKKGEDLIQISIPSTEPALCKVIQGQDYRGEVGEFLNMTIVNPVALIRTIVNHRVGGRASEIKKTFLLELSNGNYRFNPFPFVKIILGDQVSVEAVEGRTAADCRIATNLSVFTDLIFNRLSFKVAIDAGDLRVDPASRLNDAEEFLSLITLRTPWYSPYADGR